MTYADDGNPFIDDNEATKETNEATSSTSSTSSTQRKERTPIENNELDETSPFISDKGKYASIYRGNEENEGDELTQTGPGAWTPPKLDEAAMHGLAWRWAEAVQPFTEASPVGILAVTLVAFGNAAGRGAYVPVTATRHHGNEFVAWRAVAARRPLSRARARDTDPR
jgi:hypothetical protein